ncbi:MAG: hypothetical protein COU25_04140 [Candidatus Levybacteria bacterium CG10_big_fil_rev_8_21_14_0_10_35_13]|nr:MAG: hypothetical protein COU25_04140 [Candidatus Levybacteria bacterium CG10_big_fil_rev_8_21_14_0_10_35_13]
MNERDKIRLKNLAGVGLAVVIGLGLESEEDTGDPLTYYRQAGEIAAQISNIASAVSLGISSYPNASLGNIAEVSFEYIKKTSQFAVDYYNNNDCSLTQPLVENYVTDVFKSEDHPRIQQISTSEDVSPEFLHDFAKEQAEINGFTLVDESKYLEQINEAQTFDEVLEAVNGYTQNYSLKITMPESDGIEDIPIRYFGVDKNKLDISVFKEISQDLLRKLYYIPPEIVRNADISEIKIIDSIYHIMLNHLYETTTFYEGLKNETNSSPYPGGFYNPVVNIIYVGLNDLKNYKFTGRVLHELSHAFLFKICGLYGTFNDKEFAALNPEGFSYGDGKSLREYKDISSNKFGYQNELEDSAYIMGDLILTFPPNDMDTIPPVLQKKVSLLIARIEQSIPGFAKYWRSLTLRTTSEIPEDTAKIN